MKLIPILSVLVFVATASAQTAGVAGPRLVTPAGVIVGGAMIGGFPGNAVKGQPYSAEEITERVQTLADGTRLTPAPQHMVFYRDSAGRTRTERSFPMPPGMEAATAPPKMIDIMDPVAGYHYNLDEVNHVARRNKMFGMAPPPPGQATVVARRPVPLANAQRVRPERSSESLGPQMIEGVMVNGTRVTTTYPIGFFGNDRPLTTVEEMWMSPELGRVVQSKTSDPRTGENTTRLTNISRSEPDPSLFQIPADYEIKDSN